MDIIKWPIDLMHETAHTINTENENMLGEHTQRWQKIHDASASLPISMQEIFNTFHTSLETHLLGTLTLHKHMGQALTNSADLANTADTSVAKAFDGFE